VSTLPISKKYTSPIAKWYRGKLMSEIMHTGYPVEKPAKNWHERAEKVGDKMEKVAD